MNKKLLTLPRDEIVRRAIIDLYELRDLDWVRAIEVCEYVGILFLAEVEESIESLAETGTIKVGSSGIVTEIPNNGYFPMDDGGLFDD